MQEELITKNTGASYTDKRDLNLARKQQGDEEEVAMAVIEVQFIKLKKCTGVQ